jgi:hypothetical protein
MDDLISRPTWQDQLATAAQTPWLAQTASQRGEALLPRFAAWYGQLQAWPRRLRRALQRKLALPLAGVALLLALGQAPSQAATIMVDGTTCTLVDAITAANTDTAQGGCPAGSGADSLVLEPPRSMVMLSHVDNTTYGPTGLPVIRSTVTIAGQGGTIARESAAPVFRLVAVNSAGDLTLQNVTLTGGVAASDFSLAGWGGGVLNHNGAVTIENSTITGNTALDGGGVMSLANDLGHTMVTLTQSTISGNTAEYRGAVANRVATPGGTATLIITKSTISGNSSIGVRNTADSYLYYRPGDATVTITQSTISDNSGCGIVNDVDTDGGHAILTIAQSTISGNACGVVNRIYLYYGPGDATVTITQSTISDNSNSGVRNFSEHSGDATLTLTESTISGNTTAYTGGGVMNYTDTGGASVTLIDSTITGNTAGSIGGGIYNRGYDGNPATVKLIKCLVAGNQAPTAPEIGTDGGDDAIISRSAVNLFGFNGDAGVTGFTPGPFDVVPSVPLAAILDPILADNGGPTRTHALVPGSPAIDATSATEQGCFGADQRGVLRPQGGGCDIGAVELMVAVGNFGAGVTGISPNEVWCRNLTTGREVRVDPGSATAWNCEAAHLAVSPGDDVATRVKGPVTDAAENIGGTVTGIHSAKAGCTNMTTGQHVERELGSATAWTCQDMGLVVAPGERVQTSVRGRIE